MTEHPTLSAALVAALADLSVVDKGRTAKIEGREGKRGYEYEYADLGDVVKLTRPVLAEHGLVVLTPIEEHGNGLKCTVVLIHSSGERMDFGPFPFPFGKDAQATGSMVTYHRRYALVSALGIAAGEDDDGALAQPRPDVQEAPDEVLCKLCDVMVPGARTDTEKMREHRVEVHGWVRTPDGKVAPPADPSGGTQSPVPSDAPSPAAPSHVEADERPGAEHPAVTEASAPGQPIDKAVERLQKRLDALPDVLRRSAEDELYEGGFMPEGVIACDAASVPTVSKVLDRFEEDANGPAGLVARAASRGKGAAA